MITKDNFLLKKNQQSVFEELTDEEAGKLIKGIFKYVNSGDSGLDGYLKIIFIPIKTEIDKNEETYRKRCETNRNNGLKGGAPKGNENAKKKETTENNQSVNKTTEDNQKQPKTIKNNMIYHNHNHISSINNHNQDNKKEIIEYEEEEKKKKTTSDTGLLGQIVDYLNSRANTHYRTSSNLTKDKINARLNEGYKLDDFIKVIDNKCNDWLGTDMEKFLRPETLFGSKFESYLNQKVTPKRKTLKDISMSDIDRAIEIEKGRSSND